MGVSPMKGLRNMFREFSEPRRRGRRRYEPPHGRDARATSGPSPFLLDGALLCISTSNDNFTIHRTMRNSWGGNGTLDFFVRARMVEDDPDETCVR